MQKKESVNYTSHEKNTDRKNHDAIGVQVCPQQAFRRNPPLGEQAQKLPAKGYEQLQQAVPDRESEGQPLCRWRRRWV